MTLDELEQDIVRRVFDESFLNERLLISLLHQYRAAAVDAAMEECAQIAERQQKEWGATYKPSDDALDVAVVYNSVATAKTIADRIRARKEVTQ